MSRTVPALLFLASFALLFSVPFAGEYPLNDDVFYGQVVLNFLQDTWVFTISPLANTTLLHALYGTLFVKLFSPLLPALGPYALLRLSVMVVALGYVLLSFFFGRLTGLSERESVVLALLMLTNPVVFNMSHTFMTDIPFSFLFLLGAYFYIKGLGKNGKRKDLVLGSIFAAASLLIRQVGIFLPIGALLVLLNNRRGGRLKRGDLFAILAIPAIALAAGGWWFYFLMGGKQNFFPIVGLQWGLRLSKIALNMAFYLFPLALLPLLNFRAFLKRKNALAFVAVLVFVVPFVVFDQLKHGSIFPFLHNTITEKGVGVVYMAPEYTAEAGPRVFADWQLWVFLFASLLILAVSVSSIGRSFLREEAVPLLLVLPYFLMTLAVGIFFDRNLMPLLPFLFYLALKYTRGARGRGICFALAIVIFGSISWYYTGNYLALHSANWSAISSLLYGQGIPRESIDGGIEFCQQGRYGGLTSEKPSAVPPAISSTCLGGDYVTSLEPISGYDTIRTFGYNDPFGREAGRIFVLRKHQQ